MSGQEVEVKVKWLKGLLDDDDESDNSASDSPLTKSSVAASAHSTAPVAPERQAEPPTEADEPNGRLAKKRPERSTQRERAKKENADTESREPKVLDKPKRTTRKRPLPTEPKAEKDGAKPQPKGKKKPADASEGVAEATNKIIRSEKPKRMEGSDEPKPKADEVQTQIPLESPTSQSAKKPKREDSKGPPEVRMKQLEPVDALIAVLEKPVRRSVKKEHIVDGAVDGERPPEPRKKTPEKRERAMKDKDSDSADGKKKRLNDRESKKSDRRSVKAKRIETSDSEQDQETRMRKPFKLEQAASVPAVKRLKRESEKKKRVDSTDENMANTLKDLSKTQVKAKAEATDKAARFKTEASEKRVRRLPKRELEDGATSELKKDSTGVKSQAKEKKVEDVGADKKPNTAQVKREQKTEAEEAESKEEQTDADPSSDIKMKDEAEASSASIAESKAVKKEEPAEEAEEGEEPEDGAFKEGQEVEKKPKTEAAGDAPALMDPLSFIIPKKKFGKGAEPRRPPPLPVNTTTVPSAGARQPVPSRSPSASPVAVEALPIRNAQPRTKNVVPVKSVPVTPQEREFMRLARKKNSFFIAASPAPLMSSSSSPYSITDASGRVLPDLTPRMKCPTKKRMKTETKEFPHAFFGVSMATPPCVDEKIVAASSSSVVNCYEQLQFQQREDLETYERKLYSTDFVPQYLRARRTLIMRFARYERKSSGLRFNTHRDREDFEAKLSARYKINKSVPRCEIPPKNWQLIMNQRQANIFLHYQHIEDAALAAARFVDDRGEPLAWKGPGPPPALLGSSVLSNSIGRSPAPIPSPSSTPQPPARPESPRRRPRSPVRRGSSPPWRERQNDRGVGRENRFNRPGDPYLQENHRRQEEQGSREGRDAQYAPPPRRDFGPQSMDDSLGPQIHVHDRNGRLDRPRSRSRSRSIAHATDDSQGTSNEAKPVNEDPEPKAEKEGSVSGSHHSSEAVLGDRRASAGEQKDVRYGYDRQQRRNEKEYRRDRRSSQDHSRYTGYESSGGQRMEEQEWRNDREGREHQHQPSMDQGFDDRGRVAHSRDWDERREPDLRMNEGGAKRERSRSRPRSFDHGREGPLPSHGHDHGHWHGGDHGRPHEVGRYQDNQRHRNPDMGMYGTGGDHDRPRSDSRDRRHRGGNGRRNRIRNGGPRRF